MCVGTTSSPTLDPHQTLLLRRYPLVWNNKRSGNMTDINPGVDLNILKKTGEAQDAYVANPNMETADAYLYVWNLVKFRQEGPSPCNRRLPLPYLGCHSELIQIIRPPLHHTPSFIQMLGVVVGRSYRITFYVCQLPLDGIRSPATLIKQGRSH